MTGGPFLASTYSTGSRTWRRAGRGRALRRLARARLRGCARSRLGKGAHLPLQASGTEPALAALRGKTTWVLFAEGARVDVSVCANLPRNLRVAGLESPDVAVAPGDAVIVAGPAGTASWIRSMNVAEAGAPVVFLNSPLSENYSLGGPLDDVEEVYYVKPISKGFVFRCFPDHYIFGGGRQSRSSPDRYVSLAS